MRDNNNDDDDDIILLSEHRVKSVIDDDILLMGDSSDDCDKHNHSEDDDIIEIGYFECKPPKKKFKKSEIIDLGNDDFTNDYIKLPIANNYNEENKENIQIQTEHSSTNEQEPENKHPLDEVERLGFIIGPNNIIEYFVDIFHKQENCFFKKRVDFKQASEFKATIDEQYHLKILDGLFDCRQASFLNNLSKTSNLISEISFINLIDLVQKLYGHFEAISADLADVSHLLKQFFNQLKRVYVLDSHEQLSKSVDPHISIEWRDILQSKWLKIETWLKRYANICFNRRGRDLKENKSLDQFEVDLAFFKIYYSIFQLFSDYVVEYKFYSHSCVGYDSCLNFNESYSKFLIETFEMFILKNADNPKNKYFFVGKFKEACHILQYLIYYSFVYSQKNNQDMKINLTKMINTLEKIYFNIDDDNMKLHYLQNLLIQPEIKLKLCERILINENTHPNTIDVNRYSIRTYSSYQLIFNYFLQYYHNQTNYDNFTYFVKILNYYFQLFANIFPTVEKNCILMNLMHDPEDGILEYLRLLYNIANEIKKNGPTKTTVPDSALDLLDDFDSQWESLFESYKKKLDEQKNKNKLLKFL